jgi:hypothetical protein
LETDTMSNNFQNELETVGVAKTRVWELAAAADRIHTAVCALDISNRKRLAKHYPAFLQLAEEFAYFDETLLGDMGVEFKRAKGAKS